MCRGTKTAASCSMSLVRSLPPASIFRWRFAEPLSLGWHGTRLKQYPEEVSHDVQDECL